MGKHHEIVNLYKTQITCAECHSGTGMLFQDWNDIPGIIPEDPKHPGWARQRRCDQNYEPACGPCDGIGGPYWEVCSLLADSQHSVVRFLGRGGCYGKVTPRHLL